MTERRKRLDFFFLIVALCMVAATSITAEKMADPDLWWHLRTGNWILEHGSVPNHETFSYQAMGKPWIAYSWLFEAGSAKLFALWGLRGVMAFTAVLFVGCSGALTMLLARYTQPIRAIMLAQVVHIPMLILATPRPWLCTILFFTLELWLLLQAVERPGPVWLIPVVPLMVLWANIHIQFIYGLGLIGVFALHRTFPFGSRGFVAAEREPKLRAKWLWGLWVVSLLASLINPYGWRIYVVVYQYATHAAPLAFIHEFQPLPFRDIVSWMVLAVACAAWFLLGRRRKQSPWLLILLAVACVCAFRTLRDIWFPLVVSSVVLAEAVRPKGSEFQPLSWRAWVIAVVVSCGLAVAVPGRFPELAFQNAIKDRFPVQACEFIESHALPPQIYNSLGWGGYLIWRLPGMPVSMDGRTNLYGDEALTRHVKTIKGARDWDKDPELSKARTILLESNSPLASILRSDSRFRLLYEDNVASVFQPAEVATLIDNMPKPAGQVFAYRQPEQFRPQTLSEP